MTSLFVELGVKCSARQQWLTCSVESLTRSQQLRTLVRQIRLQPVVHNSQFSLTRKS